MAGEKMAPFQKIPDACRTTGLGEFLETHTNYYAHTSLSHFKHTGTSAVEAIAIKREELARKWLTSRRKGGKGT